MPGLTRVGDLESGHDGFEPVRLATGSPNVFINGRRAGRVGDVYEAHGGHRDVIVSGSPSIFINGRPAARVGDSVSPGGSAPAAGGLRGARAAGDAEEGSATGTAIVWEASTNVGTLLKTKKSIENFVFFYTHITMVLNSHPDVFGRTIIELWKIALAEASRATTESVHQGILLPIETAPPIRQDGLGGEKWKMNRISSVGQQNRRELWFSAFSKVKHLFRKLPGIMG